MILHLDTGTNVFPGANAALRADGDNTKNSEELIAYEFGIRQEYLDARLTFDLAVFYNDYSNLQTLTQEGSPLPQYLRGDDMKGESHGIELTMDWDVNEWLDIKANYSYFSLDLHGWDEDAENSDPRNHFNLQADIQLTKKLSWHNVAYYVDRVDTYDIDAYIRFDSGLIYKHSKNMEFSIWGQNLLDPLHEEYGDEFFADQQNSIPRGVYAQFTYKF